MTPGALTMSVIVPAHAANAAFESCLASLHRLSPPPAEVVIVDDGGEGRCAAAARGLGFRAVETSGGRGPAVARNLGAASAVGDILVFFDADVVVPPATVGQMAERFATDPAIDAIIGSYDETPGDTGFLSQYKNLVHRYIHQRSSEVAFTFWGACGAVRRRAFEAVGGFDEVYGRPSIEDIELGYRLREAGYQIRLDRRIEVTHLKRWTLRSLLRSDIGDRAVPWTRLIVRSGHVPNDLNLSASSRIAALLACLLVPSAVAALAAPRLWPLPAVGAVVLLGLDAPLWRFLHAKGGLLFVARSVLWHWFYYVYSSVVFVVVAVSVWFLPAPPGRGPAGPRGEAPHGLR